MYTYSDVLINVDVYLAKQNCFFIVYNYQSAQRAGMYVMYASLMCSFDLHNLDRMRREHVQ